MASRPAKSPVAISGELSDEAPNVPHLSACGSYFSRHFFREAPSSFQTWKHPVLRA